jgi:hypothetical protein
VTRDTLHLLPPGFEAPDFPETGRHEYCPECAEIWGVLHYYPAILQSLDIVYQPIDHPRPALVERLGAGEWNCPTLILHDSAPAPDGVGVKEANSARYLDSARSIGRYYAARFGVAHPRGG